MARKRKRPDNTEQLSDMTPIIDCAFNLLIFFILTLKFTTTEGQISAELPKDKGLAPTRAEKTLDPLKIHIRYDEKTKEATFTAGTAKTTKRAELLGKIKNFMASSKDMPIEISPDAPVPYRFLVLVLDVCREAGSNKINFSGVPFPVK